MRVLSGPAKYIVIILGLFITLFSLYTARWGVFQPFVQRGIHFACLLPMAFLLYPATKNSPKDTITLFDGILAILAALPSIYIVVNSSTVESRINFVTSLKNIELALGVLLVLLILEAVRRAVAPAMTVLIVISLLYLPLGSYMPGMLKHGGMSFARTIESAYLLSGEGVYGSLMGISATYIILFIIFGSVVMKIGAGDFFTQLARALAGGTRGGPAKIATISSALFGTLTGSAVANVYATGNFTIPMMKKRGFKPQFAAAVEATASTGGQIMPPVMGAAAFIMAENLSTSYIQVALHASLVAIMWYFSLMMMIHFRCLKEGIKGEPKNELPSLKQVLKDTHLFLPVIILFYMLIKGYSPSYAAFTSIISALVVSFLRKDTRMTPRRIAEALVDGAKNATMVAIALAGAGIIVVAVTYSGLAVSFSSMVITLSFGIKALALLLIAISCIILGMGVPSTAAYVIAAALGSQVLIRLGVEPLAAHMFVFYFAIISNITPPVAIAAYAGANIAGSEPIRTGVEASKIAIVGYMVPFMFAYNPVLLLQGTIGEIIVATITAGAGIIILAAGIQGWYSGLLNTGKRIVLIIAAFGLINPNPITGLIAILLVAVIIFLQKRQNPTKLDAVQQ
ncbi:MAG: hypothetical protein APF84_09585 [Gracilibacter sp. BRH_c7a]|nr:MAG: hypothetical protein APF84_09585 [Gracilibacter sp. BRH_c7a]